MDIALLFWIAIGLGTAMGFAWLAQRLTGSSGWIDTIWSFTVGTGGVAAALLIASPDAQAERKWVVITLAAIWSIRLGAHIGMRTRSGEEDPRYAKLIAEWGSSASWRLLLFLEIQALAAFVLVLAIYLAAANPEPFPRLQDMLAIGIAMIAIMGEALADAQLARFRKSGAARSEVCEMGLWRYSRHPNYFFEWLGWCAWPLLAIGFDGSFGWGWLSLLAPLLMYLLLVHVSGIPPLEEHMLRSRGEKFRTLQRRVNAFFPGPRRSGRPEMEEQQ